MGVAGIDVDLLVFLAPGEPARLFPILRKKGVGALEILLAGEIKFGLAVFEFNRVIHVASDAAEWVAVGGHAQAENGEIGGINRCDKEYQCEDGASHLR